MRHAVAAADVPDAARAGLVASRILEPHTKLATTRWWHTCTLADEWGVADATEDDLYRAMDWLLARPPRIEQMLAARHLTAGGFVLYDLTSTYMTGTHCPLAKRGYSRDDRRNSLQVNVGVISRASSRTPTPAFRCHPGHRAVGASTHRKM